jgi:hypothetical protein
LKKEPDDRVVEKGCEMREHEYSINEKSDNKSGPT